VSLSRADQQHGNDERRQEAGDEGGHEGSLQVVQTL
jgi:hypothetical protein